MRILAIGASRSASPTGTGNGRLMEFKDYYKTLGVSKTATAQEIKAAYRSLARKHHPDFHPGDKKAEDRFKEINEAYEILSDPDKRKKYDELGANWEQILRDREFAKQYARPGFEEWGAEGFDLGDFFETFFGHRGMGDWSGFPGRRPSGARRGTDLEQEVSISLEEAFQGSERRLALAFEDVCSACQGTGMEVGRTQRREGRRIITEATACLACRGTGRVRDQKTLQVKIPRGAIEGARVRLAGMGGKGSGGGPPGDLFLKIRLLPHKQFSVKGSDLVCELPVLDYEAALGAEIQVPTLGGSVWLKIPPDTQSGTQLRLKGKGLPHFQGDGAGDLYFTVKVMIPTDLSEGEKAILEQLRAARQKRGEIDPRKGLRE